MHQKKSEVQIGKDSSGISSDFNPTPPFLFPPIISQKHPILHFDSDSYPISNLPSDLNNGRNFGKNSSSATTPKNTLLSTPHKRPLMNPSNSIVKSPTLSNSLHQYPFSGAPNSNCKRLGLDSRCPSLFVVISNAKSAIYRLFRRVRHIRRLRVHFRLLLLLSLPFFYFLVSHPSRSFILDFLSAFAFSAALLFSLNLALPRLPSIRVFLNRSFPFPIKLSGAKSVARPLPVFWSIGSKAKSEKKVNSGCWVQVYSNGDVYEGEFHKGKCSGSGVYHYYLCGKFEGDWVDGKYDGYGVETWAKGSRYRGQYRNGLRHGVGVYTFYTGDVYQGEWSNGQSHGCGVYSSMDGSKYVGEFKWGVKHGFGHYHYRNGDVYAGEYFADKMHGFGVYKFANGHQYEGSWHEGTRQGFGVYTFKSGVSQSGHWQNGLLDKPTNQATAATLPGPGSPLSPVSSKISNAIEEARQASRRAYGVPNLDDRVSKAVASANRAANAARVSAVKAIQNRVNQRGAATQQSTKTHVCFHVFN